MLPYPPWTSAPCSLLPSSPNPIPAPRGQSSCCPTAGMTSPPGGGPQRGLEQGSGERDGARCGREKGGALPPWSCEPAAGLAPADRVRGPFMARARRRSSLSLSFCIGTGPWRPSPSSVAARLSGRGSSSLIHQEPEAPGAPTWPRPVEGSGWARVGCPRPASGGPGACALPQATWSPAEGGASAARETHGPARGRSKWTWDFAPGKSAAGRLRPQCLWVLMALCPHTSTLLGCLHVLEQC